MQDAWSGFNGSEWRERIDVASFINANVSPFLGDAGFLQGPSGKTSALWDICNGLRKEEQEMGGVLDIDTTTASSIISYSPGYIDKDLELIPGLQTSHPLERPVHCQGGIRMAEQACQAYGHTLDSTISRSFRENGRTHNDAVFAAYTPEMKLARKLGILTGLPDSYGRGRIIGDYRRVAIYGTSALIRWKTADMGSLSLFDPSDLNLRDEIPLQIEALKELEILGDAYGLDLRRPAADALEAFRWTYMAYLAALKQQNGAAMSLGRISTFLDIYMERDLAEGKLSEDECQELVDQLVIKLRMARMLRTPDYNSLFAGDPLWITESLGGMAEDGRTLVTKNSFRFLQTLRNLGPAPEPNLTVLWSVGLPQGFKEFCAEISRETSSIQFENDDLMMPEYGDDYGIACCVSAATLGKGMQFFGARCNLPKLLLLAINGGRDEGTGTRIGPELPYPQNTDGTLDYSATWRNLMGILDWFVPFYAGTMNLIHSMHDKYCYESLQMSLVDSKPKRYMAFGIAGLSIAADSLSAIRFGETKVGRDAQGLGNAFTQTGEFPYFGNDDEAVDSIATALVSEFNSRLKECGLYRNAEPTLSVLTITSNVVYGKKTGATPDGRKAGEPFAPGANPLHGRDSSGLLASMNSVSKIPYGQCRDGISYTITLTPNACGKTPETGNRVLAGIIDGYFLQGGHHLNINMLNRKSLEDAMANPEKYPNLTLRVSGYAVHFVKLSRDQQLEVLKRTCFDGDRGIA